MNLSYVPLSLIGAAYATAAFPVLAEQANRQEAFRTTLTVAARHIIFWSSVVTVLAIVLRAHIVRILLGAGAFDWDDTRLTAAVLAILILGLLAQGIVLLASRAFYAAGRSWNPFLVQAAGLVLSVAGAVVFFSLAQVYPLLGYAVEAALRVPDVPGTSILFVAFGATLGQLAMGGLALATLRSVAPGVARSLARPLFDGLGAAMLGGAASYGALAVMGTIAPLTTLPLVFAQGAIAGIVGLIVAGTVLALLENKEFHDLVSSLRKLRSANALPPYGLANDRPNT
jgi:peptidoglycan biosynthesis protein MviN/MurJ (putative lipid II flippase)